MVLLLVHWTKRDGHIMRSLLDHVNERLNWSAYNFSSSQLHLNYLGNCVTLDLPYCNFRELASFCLSSP